MYRQMVLIRTFEEKALACMRDGLVAGVIHPYTGHEAVAVGVLAGRNPEEWVVSYYRCHGHALAAGSPPAGLMREILGRRGGVCGGKGGSMHLADRRHRFLGTSSIVAGQLSVAAGVAMAEKLARSRRAVIVFCGDGAFGAGVSYETLTIALMLQLPLLVVCEDNGWQDATASHLVRRNGPADVVRGLRVPCQEVDGNDVELVAATANGLLQECRCGKGLQVLVAHTYLMHFHSQMGVNPPKEYRPEQERVAWAARDPIARAGCLVDSAETIRSKVVQDMEVVVAGAIAAAQPEPNCAFSSVTVVNGR